MVGPTWSVGRWHAWKRQPLLRRDTHRGRWSGLRIYRVQHVALPEAHVRPATLVSVEPSSPRSRKRSCASQRQFCAGGWSRYHPGDRIHLTLRRIAQSQLMALAIGSRLGHYDVTALIGEGGIGRATTGASGRSGDQGDEAHRYRDDQCQTSGQLRGRREIEFVHLVHFLSSGYRLLYVDVATTRKVYEFRRTKRWTLISFR